MDCLDLLFFVAVALLVLTKGGKIPAWTTTTGDCVSITTWANAMRPRMELSAAEVSTCA